MANMSSKTSTSNDTAQEIKKMEPNLIQRAGVAIAETFGWLNEIDGSLVSTFRKEHPVFGKKEKSEESQK